MQVISSNKGVIIIGDVWDYKLRKAEMVWELALRIIPKNIQPTGKWTDSSYLENAQKILTECHGIVAAVFTEDK